VSDDALDLAFRTGLPFVGLRDHEHDPELDTIVPPAAARSARAVPLAAAADHVRLAVADPDTDLTALTPYLAGRRVELAIAPREEVESVLGPADPSAAQSTPDETAPRDEAPREAGPEHPLDAAAESEPPAPPEPPALDAEVEAPDAAAEPEPPAAAPEPPAPDAEAEAPDAAVEPQAAAQAGGEPPSWLEPPRKRSRLRVVGLVLLILLLLAVIGGAVAAYFLTR
jgi:hypothetical protein